MTPFKNPLVAVGEALRKDAEIRARQPLITEDEFVALAEQIKEHGPRDRFIQDFVAGLLPAGDETQATPASRRRSPERGAAAGRQGAGDGQHLHVVGHEVVDLVPFIKARDRRQGRVGPFTRPTGGSAA